VDDFLSGADSDAEGCALIRDYVSIMDLASMSLSKWCSNSSKVAYLLDHEFENKFLTTDSVKVLGMRWLAEIDCFSFDCMDIPDGLVITKTVVLSYISRVSILLVRLLHSPCCLSALFNSCVRQKLVGMKKFLLSL
jgi:hypothetical protein